jgi:hypothetical protein
MGRRAVACLLGVYLGVLSLIAFWPSPVDRPYDGQLSRLLQALHRHGFPVWFDYGFVESASNVLLFVPFGFLMAVWLGRRSWWAAMIIGCAASCSIELGQLIFLSARTASVADVAVNTAGAVLGALMARAFLGVVRRRRQRTVAARSAS